MLSKAYTMQRYTFCKQQAITIIYNLQLSTIYTIHTGTSEENNIKFENVNFATVPKLST